MSEEPTSANPAPLPTVEAVELDPVSMDVASSSSSLAPPVAPAADTALYAIHRAFALGLRPRNVP